MAHRVGVLVVTALVALNVYLVPLAFRSISGPSTDPLPPTPTGPETEAPSPRASRPQAPETETDASLMLTATGQTVVRATRGTCGGTAPTLDRSEDGGANFTEIALPGSTSEVLTVEALSSRTLALTALDGECEPVRYVSSNRGGDWEVRSARGHWSRGAKPREVISPTGPIDVPCIPADLSMVKDDFVRVLCPDGRILRTFDDQTWTEAGRARGARAIRFPVADIGFVLARRGECAAAVLRTADSGATWEQLDCVGDEPGRAIAGQDGRYVAQAGDVIQVSSDGGETWVRP